MDFIDQIQELTTKIPKQIEHITTEEATKSALIMPFINALGYNVFDPAEVVPEFVADVGIKKGEKVDYAILSDGHPIMLFECKSCDVDLDHVHASQLYRYFSVTQSRLGVLTNGIIYRFFSDLEEMNKMDSKPFLEIDMLNLNENLIAELKKLTKSKFDIEEIVIAASDLKYTKEIKRILNDELSSPSDNFIRFFGAQVYSGKLTQTVRQQFKDVVKRAFGQFISEKINDRLKSALAQESPDSQDTPDEQEVDDITENGKASKIVTTEEELEGYHIIKAILRETIDPARIVYRDTQSYLAVLMDDNNRKTICRFYFNLKSKKYIAFFDENKNEEKVEIQQLNNVFQYADKLKSIAKYYE